MGMHLLVVAAIHLSRAGAGAGAGVGAGAGASMISPGLAGNLIWPFLLKLCLSVKISPQDLVFSSRFLLFQIAQIFTTRNSSSSSNNNLNGNSNSNSNSRFDRAIRLVRERVALARDSPVSLHHDDEESLHILSMLAL